MRGGRARDDCCCGQDTFGDDVDAGRRVVDMVKEEVVIVVVVIICKLLGLKYVIIGKNGNNR